MFERFAKKLLVPLTRHPYIALVLIAAFVSVSLPGTINLFKNIRTDLTSLLPEDYRSVRQIKTVREKMQGIGTLMLVVEGQSREALIQVTQKLSERLEQESYIKEASYTKPGYQYFVDHKLLFVGVENLTKIRDRIDRRIQKEKLGDLFISFDVGDEEDELDFDDLEEKYSGKYTKGKRSKYYENDEGTIFLIHISPVGNSANLGFAKRLNINVQRIVDEFEPKKVHPSIQVYLAGSFRNRVNQYNTLIDDLKIAGLVAALGVALLLLLRFRHFIALPVLFAPMLVGLSWTFSLTNQVIGQLNVVTSFLFSILTGLGVEFGIHLYSRYLEEKQHGMTTLEAIEAMMLKVGKASLTSAATAGIPFLLLGLNDFKGFSEFGIITGAGIFITLLAYLLVLPPLLVITDRWQFLQVKSKPVKVQSRTAYPKAGIIFWTSVILSLGCMFLLPRLSFEYDFGKLKPIIPGYQAIREKYWQVVPPKSNPSMIIVQSDDEAIQVKEEVLKRKRENPKTLIGGVKILSDLVPNDQDEKLKIIRQTQQLMEDPLIEKLVKEEKRKKDIKIFKDSLNVKKASMKDVPNEIQKVFWGDLEKVPGQLVFISGDSSVELNDGKNAIQFRDEISGIQVNGKKVFASSDSIIFADVIEVMLRDSSKAILLTLLGVLFFVFLDFRKPAYVGLVMLPIFGGVFWMCGLMGLIGFKFNFYNMVVIPAVIGTAIDNGVHMFHRYREENYESVWRVVRTTGKAAFMSSMTNMVGFAGLTFASHPGLSSIGWAAVIGMIACMISSLTLFPAALQIIKFRRDRVSSLRGTK